MTAWQDISTAPKDGRVIIVSHEECGSFPMAWNASATNELFSPGVVGMWEAIDGSMTWQEGDDCGPDRWQPLPEPPESGK